jgi:hypothetical protein
VEVSGQRHAGTDWRPGKRSTETHGLAGCVQVLVGDRICAVSSTFLVLSKANEFVLSGRLPRLAKESRTKQNKTIPLQAWKGPEGSRRMRLPDFKTFGKVVSPTQPRKYFWYSFLLEAKSTPGP